MKSKYSFRKEWYTNIMERPTDYYMEPFRICGNLYFVGNKDGASHLIDTGDGLILFDTGYSNMGGMLLDSIWRCGFDPADLKLIFHTHGHFDHFGATKLLQRISGAKTLVGELDAAMFREHPEWILDDYFQGIPTERFVPDVELFDGQEVTLGNTTVTAIHTPGHCVGTMTYRFLVHDGDKTYRATLCGGAGFNTLNCDFIEETGLNYRPDFEASLARWKQMETDIFLGNHTPQSNVEGKRARQLQGEADAFISKTEWAEYVENLEKNFRKMIEEEG